MRHPLQSIAVWAILLFGGTFAPLIALLDWGWHYFLQGESSRPFYSYLSDVYGDLRRIIEIYWEAR